MQLSLFNTIDKNITILEASKMLQVSVATINNWLKTGLLESSNKGYISLDSINRIFENQEKLRSRANKQHKDSHNHNNLSFYISEQIKGENWMELSKSYENSLSESYRNKEGIYYTPLSIVREMLNSIQDENLAKKTFLEPCCGSGNFIIEAIKKGVQPENIYAFDTDLNAVEIARKRVYELTGYHSENIIQGDFLTMCKTRPILVDYIFTNPPWGKKTPLELKRYYATLHNAGDSTDSCSLFFFACLSVLKEGGKMGFLLPEAFFNISSFENARCTALSYRIEGLTDFGRFEKLMTRAQAIILSKIAASEDLIVCKFEGEKYSRKQTDFLQTPKNIINFQIREKEADVVRYLLSIPHKTLRGRAKWGLGVVTGNNAKLLKNKREEGFVPIFRGREISKEGFASPKTYINKNLIGCQQVAAKEFYWAPEKIVYRFIGKDLVFFCDRQQNLILNSANLLIPDDSFDISMQQITDLLNSEVVNWLFNKIFHTTKVLRRDLEFLPIYEAYFKCYGEFNEENLLNYLNIEKKDGTYRIKRADH